jgi:hypothetical protein
LVSIPFQNNHNLTKEHNLPSLASQSYGELPEDSTCSPHITFTTQSFYNPPHIDKKDVSQYASALFIPTCLSDGSLADSSEYDVTSGPFIVPDHQFGINFDAQHGIVKMVWQANRYTHCTFPHSPSSSFTRLGMSVQINSHLVNACDRYNKGFYKDVAHYFGDHFYLFCSLGKGASTASVFTVILFFNFFIFF